MRKIGAVRGCGAQVMLGVDSSDWICVQVSLVVVKVHMVKGQMLPLASSWQ